MKTVRTFVSLVFIFVTVSLMSHSCMSEPYMYFIDDIHVSNIENSGATPEYLNGSDVSTATYGIRVFNHLSYADHRSSSFTTPVAYASGKEDVRIYNEIEDINIYTVQSLDIDYPASSDVTHLFYGRSSYDYWENNRTVNDLIRQLNNKVYNDELIDMDPFDVFLIHKLDKPVQTSFVVELIIGGMDTIRDTTGYVNLKI